MIKNKNTIVAMTVMVVSIVVFILTYYSYGMSSVSKDTTEVTVTIESGSLWSVASTLKENKLINSRFWFYFYCRGSKNTNLLASTYKLNRSMNVKEIVAVLAGNGNGLNDDEISITFPEGINMRKLADIIDSNTNNTSDDVFNLLSNSEYIDNLINDYWFLSDDIKNKDIYYPLEGYLYPETYNFKDKDVSIEDIFKKLLDQFGKELELYREEVTKSNLSIHEIITLASMVELEANNIDNRKGVAGVFLNRINDGWSLGSDVTTYYGFKVDKNSEFDTSRMNECSNAYNTRCPSLIGLPIGPIANVSKDSIEAVLRPDVTNYYYFVSDCDGNVYFSKTNAENLNNKDKLIKKGKWCA